MSRKDLKALLDMDEAHICDAAGRPSDQTLYSLQTILRLSMLKKVQPPEFPPNCLLSLVDEILEARALAAGAVAKLMAEQAKPDGANMGDRPSDSDLAEFAKLHRDVVLAAGVSHKCSIEDLALVTLADELIELRKAPRA